MADGGGRIAAGHSVDIKQIAAAGLLVDGSGSCWTASLSISDDWTAGSLLVDSDD